MRNIPIKKAITQVAIASLLTGGAIEANADAVSALLRAQMAQTEYISQQARKKLKQQTANTEENDGTPEAPATYYLLIIKLSDEATDIPDYVTPIRQRGNLMLAFVESRFIEQLENTDGIERIEANNTLSHSMVDAIKYCSVGDVMRSDSNPTGLTGEGVVTGLCDIGLMPNHITFLDNDGKSRFKKVVEYDRSTPSLIVTEGENVGRLETDSPDETHATHVAGIMAGNGAGTGYGGIAPGSEIVGAVGTLSDAFLLAGCEEIVDYAKKQGKPAVINMSISSTVGPHDGTTLFNQYMDEICKDATVCISAGNEGSRNGYLEKKFQSPTDTLRTYPRAYPSWSSRYCKGVLDMWGMPGEQYKVSIICIDSKSDKILQRIPAIDIASGRDGVILSSDPTIFEGAGYPIQQLHPALEGYVYIISEENPENGRMNVVMQLDFTHVTDDSQCAYGIEVTSDEGAKVEIYSTETVFLNSHWDKSATTGNPSRSINDFVTSKGPISVGAMSSQNRNQLITGEWVDYTDLTIGDIAYFSSYGTLNDGTVLPDIVAPGAQTISTISTPYLQGSEDRINKETSFKITHGAEPYYWGSMQGTSMSSPFAAGVIALWLEAYPELTPAEVKEIAIRSTDKPTVNPTNPQWGKGILNASKGLELAREIAGIGEISAQPTAPLIEPLGSNRFRISLPGAESRLQVVSIAGQLMMEQKITQKENIADLSQLTPGIYVMKIGGHTMKTIVR